MFALLALLILSTIANCAMLIKMPGKERKLIMPIDDTRDPRLPAVHDQLVSLVEKIPEIRTIYLYTRDGLGISFYSLREIAHEEDDIAPMTHAMFILNTSIAQNLKIGRWNYYIASTKQGRCLYLTIPGEEDLVLILVLAPNTSLDALFAAIKQNWQPLLELIKD